MTITIHLLPDAAIALAALVRALSALIYYATHSPLVWTVFVTAIMCAGVNLASEPRGRRSGAGRSRHRRV